MNKKNILIKIREAFVIVLGHENFTLEDKTTANDVDGWESVTHIMIVSEIEKILNIKFKLMDLMNMDNVGDLLKTIEKELKKQH